MPDVPPTKESGVEMARATANGIISDAERNMKRATGEGYTFEQGRLAAARAVLDAIDGGSPGQVRPE